MARARRPRELTGLGAKRYLIAALAVAGCGTTPISAPDDARGARVIAVVDGDTIKVRLANGGRETVRLVGIDTPESRKPNTPVECGAKQAGAALSRLVSRRDVTLVRDPSQDARDRYGRTLAYVDVGSRDAGEEMVRSGWAEPYVYEVPFARLRAYRAAGAAAKRRGAGVHGACGSDFHRRGERANGSIEGSGFVPRGGTEHVSQTTVVS